MLCVEGSVSIGAGTRSRAQVSEFSRPAFTSPQGPPSGTQLGCSGHGGLWEGTGQQRDYKMVIIRAGRGLLQSLFYSYHPRPHKYKTNFPHCFSKTEMEEMVVEANEYFSKAFIPSYIICSGNFKWGPNAVFPLGFTLLIKEETTDRLSSLNQNLWTHSGHYSFLFFYYLCNFQPGRQKRYNFKSSRYLLIEGL